MPSKRFHHRRDAEGLWRSICGECFLTVVAAQTARSEHELAVTDEQHQCGVSERDMGSKSLAARASTQHATYFATHPYPHSERDTSQMG
jgi:hypothetical protein